MMTTSEPTLFPLERDPRLRLIVPGVVAMGFTLDGLDSTGMMQQLSVSFGISLAAALLGS
jgi:hypothetical protein